MIEKIQKRQREKAKEKIRSEKRAAKAAQIAAAAAALAAPPGSPPHTSTTPPQSSASDGPNLALGAGSSSPSPPAGTQLPPTPETSAHHAPSPETNSATSSDSASGSSSSSPSSEPATPPMARSLAAEVYAAAPGLDPNDALLAFQQQFHVPCDLLARTAAKQAKKREKQAAYRAKIGTDTREALPSWDVKQKANTPSERTLERRRKKAERLAKEKEEKERAEIAGREVVDLDDVENERRAATKAAMAGKEVVELD